MAIDFKNSILYDESDCPQGKNLKDWRNDCPTKTTHHVRKAFKRLARVLGV